MTPDDAGASPPPTTRDFANLSAPMQERIDQACDDFEAAWRAVLSQSDPNAAPTGGWPELADCVARLPSHERLAALHELIPIDVSYRRRCGAPIALTDYARLAELEPDWLSQIVLNPDGATRQVSHVQNAALDHSTKAPTEPPPLALFVSRLIDSGVLDGNSVERTLALLPSERRTTDELGQQLIAQGLLTGFQFNSLLQTPPPRLVLGDYLLLAPLGQGGMGTVYRARHRPMNRVVAVKVLPPSTAHDPHAVNRFRREIRAVARLSHPHIVAAHDAGDDDGIMFLVMECIDGLDLATWVRRHGPLSVADAVDCIAQAADGMSYAHQQGIIHRDLKPSNLLVSRTPSSERRDQDSLDATANVPLSPRSSPLTLKILDLGLARIDAESPTSESTAVTRSGMIFGTAEYMSPEQARNVRSADQRSDIYSLGCTLFFLLTGRPVVKGETYMEMVLAHQLLELPSLAAARSDVPVELELIFRRMTARKPDDRFASMHEVRDALRAIPRERLPLTPASDGLRNRSDAPSLASPTDWLTPQTSSKSPVTPADHAAPPNRRPNPPTEQLPVTSPSTVRLWRWPRHRGTQLTLAALITTFVVLAGVWTLWRSPADDDSTPPANAAPEPLQSPASEAVAQQRQREWANHLGVQTSLRNSIGMVLMLIPPGEFTLGTSEAEFETLSAQISDPDELATVRHEMPARQIRLERPFWIGQTEVTVRQFRQFVDESRYVTEAETSAGYGVVNDQWVLQPGFSWRNTGEQQLSDEFPVCNLSWNDAAAFCDWLSRRESREPTRTVRYRLPTEAEWEFACRAGSTSLWFFGSDAAALEEYAVTFSNSSNRHSPVGSKRPNALQLFDLYGNESEWCSDWFAPYSSAPNLARHPSGPRTGIERVQRGGSFNFSPHRQRSAMRDHRKPNSPLHGGLRVVREQ